MDEKEIQEALDIYCSERVKVPEGKKIRVEFTVGRGSNGTTAKILFEDIVVAEELVAEPVDTPKEAVKEKEVEAPAEEVKDVKTEDPEQKEVKEKDPDKLFSY